MADKTQLQNATVDMASALKDVFKKYTRQTRSKAWSKLTSRQGMDEVEKILQDPNRPLSQFRKLNFAEWFTLSEES
jgi:hypothetical protein